MRKTSLMIALCTFLHATPLRAAFDYFPVDPKGTAMSGTMTAITGNAWGVFYNPASTASTERSAAGISYAIPYGDSNLDDLSAAVSISKLPFDKHGTVSAGMNRYHANSYHEQTIVAGYASELLPSVRVGISVSRMSQKISGFGENSTTGIGAGLQADITSTLTFGISSTNLNSPTIGTLNNRLPKTTLTGLAWRLKTGSLLTVNALSDPDRSGRLLVAGDFPVYRSLHMMAGAATNPSLISAGASFGSDTFKATAAVSRDIDLGTTSSFGVAVTW